MKYPSETDKNRKLWKYFFPVTETKVQTEDMSNNFLNTNDYKAIVREDSSKLISIQKKSYKLVSNLEVIEPVLSQLNNLTTDWIIDESHSFVEDGRMRLQVTFPELTLNDGRSDIALSLFIHNSYDGSEGVRMFWGAIRGICSNGMVFGEVLAKFYARHTSGIVVDNLVEQVEATYEQIPVIKQRIPELKIIGYFTIDGDPLPEQWFPILRSCDHIIVPSQFGKRVIEERWTERPISMIPQGVELKDFFLKESKEEFKKSVDKETIELSEKMKKAPLLHSGRFVVFFAGMNQTKKNIGAILDGFVQFAAGKDDVFLYLVLHSHIEEKYGMKVVSDYDITDLYSWIHESGKFRIISESLSF